MRENKPFQVTIPSIYDSLSVMFPNRLLDKQIADYQFQ